MTCLAPLFTLRLSTSAPTSMNHTTFLRVAASILLVVLAGCATYAGEPGPPAPAPTFKAGDRWVYGVSDGFRVVTTWEETHEVTSATPQGITVAVTAKGPTVDDRRTETWSAPGVVISGAVFDNETRRFEPPLIRYRYPLAMGERWNQRMRDANHDSRPYGGIERDVRVGGYEKVTTPAGTFDTMRLTVIMRLDDETFWRWPTECAYTIWYAPALGIAVREQKYAWYTEKGGSMDGTARIQSQNARVELVSTTRR